MIWIIEPTTLRRLKGRRSDYPQGESMRARSIVLMTYAIAFCSGCSSRPPNDRSLPQVNWLSREQAVEADSAGRRPSQRGAVGPDAASNGPRGSPKSAPTSNPRFPDPPPILQNRATRVDIEQIESLYELDGHLVAAVKIGDASIRFRVAHSRTAGISTQKLHTLLMTAQRHPWFLSPSSPIVDESGMYQFNVMFDTGRSRRDLGKEVSYLRDSVVKRSNE